MLAYQAAIAFKMCTGEEAPLDEMKSAIKAEFSLYIYIDCWDKLNKLTVTLFSVQYYLELVSAT